MTDHAKALADALRNIIALAKPHFSDDVQALAMREAQAALAAYDAEAATRENGEPKKSYTVAVATDVLAWFTPHLKHIVSFHTLCEAMERILSTHQQQGARND